jgi:tripartite-type tricarboxylate transporter receptor subunit TctC
MGAVRFVLTLCLLALSCTAPAGAQSWPTRPITMVVPFPPGGAATTLARLLAEHMRGPLGQPVIVENVPGAGGTVGVGRVARAAPDGSMLSFGNWASHVGASAIYPVHYDVLKDLAPVARIADTPLWMVARNSLPAKDLRELVAWLKVNPDKASAATVGAGSAPHLCDLSAEQYWHALPDGAVSRRRSGDAGPGRRASRLHVRYGRQFAAARAQRHHQGAGCHGENALVRGARSSDRG